MRSQKEIAVLIAVVLATVAISICRDYTQERLSVYYGNLSFISFVVASTSLVTLLLCVISSIIIHRQWVYRPDWIKRLLVISPGYIIYFGISNFGYNHASLCFKNFTVATTVVLITMATIILYYKVWCSRYKMSLATIAFISALVALCPTDCDFSMEPISGQILFILVAFGITIYYMGQQKLFDNYKDTPVDIMTLHMVNTSYLPLLCGIFITALPQLGGDSLTDILNKQSDAALCAFGKNDCSHKNIYFIVVYWITNPLLLYLQSYLIKTEGAIYSYMVLLLSKCSYYYLDSFIKSEITIPFAGFIVLLTVILFAFKPKKDVELDDYYSVDVQPIYA